MLVLGAFNAVVYKDQLKGKFKFEKQACPPPTLTCRQAESGPSPECYKP